MMKTKKSTMSTARRADLVFYICLMAFPVLQFFVMYICVNFNSILLAFQDYNAATGVYSFAGVSNFERVFFLLFQSEAIGNSWQNSLVVWMIGTFISIPLSLLFSYYIYKKLFLHKVFKVLLFLPSVLSVVVMAILYRYFVERGIIEIAALFGIQMESGLLANGQTVFFTIVFFGMLMSTGPHILMYVGAMSGISESLSESAQLDGCGLMQEFIYITIPCIWSTIVTFLIVQMISVFSNQLNLYNFYQGSAELKLYTFGYYLFRCTNEAKSISEYPVLAAMGIVFTAIIVPVTLFVRKMLTKYGPSRD